jgi:hypothetical protein
MSFFRMLLRPRILLVLAGILLVTTFYQLRSSRNSDEHFVPSSSTTVIDYIYDHDDILEWDDLANDGSKWATLGKFKLTGWLGSDDDNAKRSILVTGGAGQLGRCRTLG